MDDEHKRCGGAHEYACCCVIRESVSTRDMFNISHEQRKCKAFAMSGLYLSAFAVRSRQEGKHFMWEALDTEGYAQDGIEIGW